MTEETLERTTLRIPTDLHNALRTEAFKTRRSMQKIITEQLEKRYAGQPLFFGSVPDLRVHIDADPSEHETSIPAVKQCEAPQQDSGNLTHISYATDAN